MDEHGVAQHDLVLHGGLPRVRQGVIEEVIEEWADHGCTIAVVVVEKRIEQRQQLIPQLQRRLQPFHRQVAKDVWLPPRSLQVGVIAQERVREHCKLIPPHHHLDVWVLEEATDVRADERLPAEGEGPNHGDGGLQVRPLRVIVACPDRCVFVRADEEGPGQHEWAVARDTFLQAFGGRTMHVVSVHVVHVSVLDHAVGMDGVPGHRHLRPVEHRGLVHVVPDVQIGVGALVLVEGEL
mmetsp:Transcript_10526/g.27887  ORF Transcript_10526/g.27887 Transcript_10526/m.27887 type:complete len:238 (-) Transcript_10526:1843-2556(-)